MVSYCNKINTRFTIITYSGRFCNQLEKSTFKIMKSINKIFFIHGTKMSVLKSPSKLVIVLLKSFPSLKGNSKSSEKLHCLCSL